MKMKKSLGQHFLIDKNVIDDIIEKTEIDSNSFILEIGPGSGALTKQILQKSFKLYKVVEFDADLIGPLKKMENPRFNVYHEDILLFNIDLHHQNKKWIILGNLPYCITSAILKKLVLWKNHCLKSVIMIQEEVAQKLIKTSGKDYTSLSLLMQYHFEIVLHKKILPEAFNKPPKVDSRIISLVPKLSSPIPNEIDFWKWIAILFESPRRTIENNIKGTKYQKITSNVLLGKRAQELQLSDFIEEWNKTIKKIECDYFF